MIPKRSENPGAFVLTQKKTGQKYVMSEKTLNEMVKMVGEDKVEAVFDVEWVELSEEEKKLAEEIRRRYLTSP
jgi:hypothetical protein